MKIDDFMNKDELKYEETECGIAINIWIHQEEPDIHNEGKWNVKIYSDESDKEADYVFTDTKQIVEALSKYFE